MPWFNKDPVEQEETQVNRTRLSTPPSLSWKPVRPGVPMLEPWGAEGEYDLRALPTEALEPSVTVCVTDTPTDMSGRVAPLPLETRAVMQSFSLPLGVIPGKKQRTPLFKCSL